MNFQSLKSNLFIILLVVISAVFIWVIRPYIGSIFWAAVLASIFYPVQKFWLRVSKDRKSLSALMSLLTIFFIVLVPLYFLGNAVVRESINLYQRLSATETNVVQTIGESDVYESVMQSLEQYGVDKEEVRDRVASSARTVSQYLFSRAAEFGQNTLVFLAEFLIMFYLLYFFLRDGDLLLLRLQYLLPLGNRKEQRLYDKFASTSRATLKGTLIIAIVQGTLGGILFWVVGITSPVLWGALMTALSVIPAVGSALIWLPAGLILLFTGNVWQGVTTLIVGTAVIGLIDNVLRPPLLGKDTEMPQAMILLSTLGGLSVFGISGFVIGPIIAAFFLAVWQMFEEEYRSELTEKG